MSIASATSKSGPYAGNGVTTVFAVGFACLAAADLSVVHTDASGNDSPLALNTDYSVSLNADQTNSPGGTVTLAVAPASGVQVTILRNVNLTQGTSLPNQGGWYPKVVENALDKLTMITQQLAEQIGRAVKVGVSSGQTPDQLIASITANSAAASASAISASGSAAAAATAATTAATAATSAAASAATLNLPAPNVTPTPAVLRSMNGANTYGEPGIKGADIASASTINLTAATGNLVHITGTTTINAIALPVGADRTIVFDGVLTLTNSAALILPGNANIATLAGDSMVVRGDTAGARVVSYTRVDGRPLTRAGSELLSVDTVSAAVANIDRLTICTAAYDRYVIEIEGMSASGTANLYLQFANAGVLDVGSTIYRTPSVDGTALSTGAPVVSLSVGASLTTTNYTTLTVDIRNANDATAPKTVGVHGVCGVTTLLREGAYMGGAISGFRLYLSSSMNITRGTVRVYGLANS